MIDKKCLQNSIGNQGQFFSARRCLHACNIDFTVISVTHATSSSNAVKKIIGHLK